MFYFYMNNLIFLEFFKTQSNQKINQNALYYQNILMGANIYAPKPPSICVQLQLI